MMVLLDGIFGLGLAEAIVVIIAIILFLEPKNIAYVKPLVKAAYRVWLEYKNEVESAKKDMDGITKGIIFPIQSAKSEAEAEFKNAREAASVISSGSVIPSPGKKKGLEMAQNASAGAASMAAGVQAEPNTEAAGMGSGESPAISALIKPSIEKKEVQQSPSRRRKGRKATNEERAEAGDSK